MRGKLVEEKVGLRGGGEEEKMKRGGRGRGTRTIVQVTTQGKKSSRANRAEGQK
jgi:hypothetical protein